VDETLERLRDGMFADCELERKPRRRMIPKSAQVTGFARCAYARTVGARV
jgi:hypothetical protein